MTACVDKTTILIARESVYSEDPGSGYTAILVNEGASFTPEADNIERNVLRPTFTPVMDTKGKKRFTFSLPIEIKGGGLNGSTLLDPELMLLLEICNFSKTTGVRLSCDNLVGGPFELKETLQKQGAAAAPASHAGTVDLSSGFDWGTTAQDFSINANGAGATTVTLNTLTTNVATTIAEINAELTTASVTGIEAYDAGGDLIGIRTTSSGSTEDFVLAAGTTDALVTLGWTAGTYTGTDLSVDTDIGEYIHSVTTGTDIVIDSKGDALVGVYSPGDVIVGATSGATAEVLTTKPSIVNNPSTSCSSIGASATIHYHQDDLRMVSTGLKSDVSMAFEVGTIPIMTFELRGLYNRPTDQSIPTGITYSEVLPGNCTGVNLQLGDIDMTTSPATKLEVKLGNSVVERADLNASDGIIGIRINDRDTNWSLDPERALQADHPAFQIWEESTTQKIYADFGNTDGNRLTIVMPAVGYNDIGAGDRDKIASYSLAGPCTGNEDDELYLIWT